MKQNINIGYLVAVFLFIGFNLLSPLFLKAGNLVQEDDWRYYVGCKMGIGGNMGSVNSPVFKIADDFLDFNTSAYIGPTVNYYNDFFKFSSGALYSVKKLIIADHTREASTFLSPSFFPYKKTYRYQLINVPLLLGYNFSKDEDFEAELYAGPSYSFIIDRIYDDNEKIKGFENVRLQEEVNGFWNFIIGFNLGFRGRFSFGFQYEHSNSNYFSAPKDLKATYHAVTFDLQFRIFGTRNYW
jgi:hypothetical protein